MPATDFVRPLWASPSGVASILIDGPTFEPLTLDDAKLRAGLDWATGDPRDALMTGFIAAARQKVEHDTGLALAQQTRQISIDAAAGSVVPLPAQATPCQSIVAIEPTPSGLLPVIGPRSWSFPYDVTGSWLVVAGWPTAAALQAEAPLLVHAVGLLVAHMATLGRDLASIDEPFLLPMGYDDAIAPYRLTWVI